MPLKCTRTHKRLVSTQTFSTNNLQVSSTDCKHGAFQHFLSVPLLEWSAGPPAGLYDCFRAPNQQRTDRCIRSLIEWI